VPLRRLDRSVTLIHNGKILLAIIADHEAELKGKVYLSGGTQIRNRQIENGLSVSKQNTISPRR